MNGIVTKSLGSNYVVRTEDGSNFECKIKGKLRLHDFKSTNPIAIGDLVEFETDLKTGISIINDIHERKNYIIRKSTNLSKQVHIIAANIDQALLIVTLIKPETTLEFIDRYLVSLEAYRIPAVIVFNKIDLYEGEIAEKCDYLIGVYEKIGYHCVKTSVTSDVNLNLFKELLRGKTSVICGNSGVGKSSLINSVEKGLNLKTSNISEYYQSGIHTTSNYEMFYLGFGAYIVDTPGIKGFGLSDFSKNEIYHFFPEIFRISSKCKYYNCLHVQEPGCAVKESVTTGTIAVSRYQSYLSMFSDTNQKYRY